MCFFVEGRTAEDLSPVCPSHVVAIYYTCVTGMQTFMQKA